MDEAMAALMAAIGNPDADTPSEAMLAFDAAIASGDATRIAATADVILAHAAEGRARLVAADGPRCGAFCVEWGELFEHVTDGVETMRDGAIARAETRVADGRAIIQTALLDHFWQGIRGDDPAAYVMRLPDGRVVDASRSRLSTPVGAAFDGQAQTAWTSGDADPPQWLAIDLGIPSELRSVRLLTYQEAAGTSDHRLSACGPDGVERELARFLGATSDGEWLESGPLEATDVRVLRVTTLAVPSTVGWREIELEPVAGASPGSSAGSGEMALCGITNLAAGATATGEPSVPGAEPALAVDGDPASRWDAGTAGRLALTLASPARITGVRILEGAGGPTTWSIVGVLPSDGRLLLAELTEPGEAGTWRAATIDDPEAYRLLELVVRSPTPVTDVLEIEVIGAPVH